MSDYVCGRCHKEYSASEVLGNYGVCRDCGGAIRRAQSPVGQPASASLELPPLFQNPPSGNGRQPPRLAAAAPPLAQPASPAQAAIPSSVADGDIVAMKVIPVKGEQRDIAAIQQLLNSLIHVAHPLSLEIAGTNNRRFILIRCRREHAEIVRSRIVAIYGSPVIEALAGEEDPLHIFEAALFKASARLGLKRSEALPLRTYRELASNDPVMPLLSALYELGAGEAGVIQLLVHGAAHEDWALPFKEEMLRIQRRQGGMLTGRQIAQITALATGGGAGLFAVLSLALGAWGMGLSLALVAVPLLIVGFQLFRGSRLEWSETQEEMVKQKIQMPGYEVEARIAAASDDREHVTRVMRSLEGAFNMLSVESGNALVLHPTASRDWFDPRQLDRHSEAVNVLGDAEIATIWHLPILDLPDMLEVHRVRHVLPDAREVAPADHSWYLGVSRKSAGEEIPVYLPQTAISQTHVLLMGRTRVGKTTTMQRLAVELAADPARGLVVVDPHDLMVEELLALLPESRLGDVRYLNFADPEFTFGFNPLDVTLFGGNPEVTAESFIEVAHSLYGRYWGPRMEVVFRNAVMAVTLANSIQPPESQYTVLDVLNLLSMAKYARHSFLDTILPDPKTTLLSRTVKSYFLTEYDDLAKQFQDQVVMPVLSKLRPFESNTFLLKMFAQPRCSFNVVAEILAGKILLVRTGQNELSDEFSNFTASILLNLAFRALRLQTNLSPDRRTRVTLIIDEAQRFAGVDFGDALATIAKFGGNVVLATQGRDFIGRARGSDQIDDPNAFNKILANIDTLLVFRAAGNEAAVLTDTEFWGELTPADLINLSAHEAFVRFTRERKVHGPYKVALAPPEAGARWKADAIRAARAAYLIPSAAALARASDSVDRAMFEANLSGQKEEAPRAEPNNETVRPVAGEVSPVLNRVSESSEDASEALAGLANVMPPAAGTASRQSQPPDMEGESLVGPPGRKPA